MSFNKRPETARSNSIKSRVHLSYQISGQKPDSFRDLWTGSPAPRSDYYCEIFYSGRVKIWNTIGNHRFTVDYEPKQAMFESLKKRTTGDVWVHLDLRYDSWKPSVRDQSDTQLIVRILHDSPSTDLSRENDAQRNSLATSSIFPLAESHKSFTRLKLQLFDVAHNRNWNPEAIISLIKDQKLNHPRKETIQQDRDVIMKDVSNTSETLDPRFEVFLDREEAAMKAERVDGEAIAAAMKAMRAASLPSNPTSASRLPIIPIFVGQGEAVKEIVPLAGRGYAVDFSHFDDINLSQQRAIQNVFNYQVSLIHAPTGCAPIATIVSATEAILRKAPKSKILVCSLSNAAADKVAEGFKTREYLCDFRFRYLRFLPRMTDDLKNTRVIICTYAAAGVERLTNSWSPQVLIADDAGRLRHYELIVPLSAHLEFLTRLILVGDHVQHGPSASTEAGQKAWEKSTFEKMVEERWPQQMLNVNYLTHSDLCYPTSLVFYRNLITASRISADPGPFLSEFLLRLKSSVQITDDHGGAAKISSFAHFFDVRSKQESSIEPEVSCVNTIVAALLSTDACKADEMMVIHGSREHKDLLTSKSKANGWSGVPIENVASAQRMSQKIAIICLPRGDKQLQNSPMSQRRAVSVFMSLATDVCFIIGTWKSICELDYTNDLQRMMFCMDESIENFLLRVGEGPYTFQRESSDTIKR